MIKIVRKNNLHYLRRSRNDLPLAPCILLKTPLANCGQLLYRPVVLRAFSPSLVIVVIAVGRGLQKRVL